MASHGVVRRTCKLGRLAEASAGSFCSDAGSPSPRAAALYAAEAGAKPALGGTFAITDGAFGPVKEFPRKICSDETQRVDISRASRLRPPFACSGLLVRSSESSLREPLPAAVTASA